MPSNWTAAFTHPDPLDPNDRVRQKTQSRAGNYPYDTPVMYGRPVGTGDDGSSYQRSTDTDPPPPEETEPDKPLGVWDRISDGMEIGPMGDDADELGYGLHGRLGEFFGLALPLQTRVPRLAELIDESVETDPDEGEAPGPRMYRWGEVLGNR